MEETKMKVSKILAGMSAAAILASVTAISASAAITNGDADGNYVYDFANAIGTAGVADYIKADDIVGVKVVIGGEGLSSYEDAAGKTIATIGGEGFGGGIVVNHGAGWDQMGWGNDAQDFNVVVADGEYYFVRDLTGVIAAEDYSLAENTWGQIVVSQWWGGDFSVESVTLIDAEGNDVIAKAVEAKAAAEKAAREAAAADALAELQAKIDALTYKDAISDMEAAADALTNAKSVLDKADAAKAEIDGLEQVLAAAEEAFAALEADDTADRDAYEAAKAAVASAKTEVDTAKAALQAAIEAYDKATADKLAEKDKDIADKQAEIDELKAQLEEAKKQNETDAATIKDLEDQIAAKDEEIEALKAEKDELQKKLDEALANANKPADDNSGSTTNTNNNGKDNTNPGTSATAGLAFAGISLAGVGAIVASKKRK